MVKMSYANGCVTRNKHEFNPKVDVKDRQKFICAECKKVVEKAHVVDTRQYCSVACFIMHRPMILTGDTTRLDRIQAETQTKFTGKKGRFGK
jgi:hypothetical protein